MNNQAAEGTAAFGSGSHGPGDAGGGALFGMCILVVPIVTQLRGPCPSLSLLGLPAGAGTGQKRGSGTEGRKRGGSGRVPGHPLFKH